MLPTPFTDENGVLEGGGVWVPIEIPQDLVRWSSHILFRDRHTILSWTGGSRERTWGLLGVERAVYRITFFRVWYRITFSGFGTGLPFSGFGTGLPRKRFVFSRRQLAARLSTYSRLSRGNEC